MEVVILLGSVEFVLMYKKKGLHNPLTVLGLLKPCDQLFEVVIEEVS